LVDLNELAGNDWAKMGMLDCLREFPPIANGGGGKGKEK
jgi:hypothetical protein